MRIEELQDTLDYYDRTDHPPMPAVDPLVDAARLVANPNIEAHHAVVKELIYNGDYTVEGSARAVAAALTPGGEQ